MSTSPTAELAEMASTSSLNPHAEPFFPALPLCHALCDGNEAALADQAMEQWADSLMIEDSELLAEAFRSASANADADK
jgi:hypothetical protein